MLEVVVAIIGCYCCQLSLLFPPVAVVAGCGTFVASDCLAHAHCNCIVSVVVQMLLLLTLKSWLVVVYKFSISLTKSCRSGGYYRYYILYPRLYTWSRMFAYCMSFQPPLPDPVGQVDLLPV